MKRTAFITAAVPLLVLFGGLGGVASAAPTAATLAPMADPDPSDDPAERIRQFTQCMRDNGIDLPDPPEGDGPVRIEIGPDEDEAFDSAMEACEALAPEHGRRVELDPALRGQIEEFHRCLEDHGVDLPEAGGPIVANVEEAGVAVVPAQRHEGPVPAHAELPVVTPLPGSQEAVEACRDLLPAPAGDGPVVVGVGGNVIVGEHGGPAGGGVGITVAVAGAGA